MRKTKREHMQKPKALVIKERAEGIDEENAIGLATATCIAFLEKNFTLWYLKEELMSECYLAYVEAKEAWSRDPSATISFNTYLVHQCQNRIINYLTRFEFKYSDTYSLDSMVNDSDDSGVTSWEEIYPGDTRDLEDLLRKLPEHLREDTLLFIEAKDMRDACSKIKGNWQAVYKKKKAIIEAIENLGIYEVPSHLLGITGDPKKSKSS